MDTAEHNGANFYAPWVFEAARLSTQGSQGHDSAPRADLDRSEGARNEPSAIRVAIRSSKRSLKHARRSLVLSNPRPLGTAAELLSPGDMKVDVASPEPDPLNAVPEGHRGLTRPETRLLVASRNAADAATRSVAAGVSTSEDPALGRTGTWLKGGWAWVSALCRGDKEADSRKAPSGHEKRAYRIKCLDFEAIRKRPWTTSTRPWENPRAKVWGFLILAVVLAVTIEASVALGLASEHHTGAVNPATPPGNETQSASGISSSSPPTSSSSMALNSSYDAVPMPTWTTPYPPSVTSSVIAPPPPARPISLHHGGRAG